MRKAVWLGVGAMVAILAVEVTAQQTAPTKPPAAATGAASSSTAVKPAVTPGSAVRYVGSVRDVMHIFVEPNADKIFDSVAIDVNETGIHEQKPETDATSNPTPLRNTRSSPSDSNTAAQPMKIADE